MRSAYKKKFRTTHVFKRRNYTVLNFSKNRFVEEGKIRLHDFDKSFDFQGEGLKQKTGPNSMQKEIVHHFLF